MRKYSPVIVLLVLILSFITVVSATDVNHTEDTTSNTLISKESTATTADIISEKTVTKKTTNKTEKTSKKNTSNNDDCCTSIIQGNNVDSVVSFRRDSSSSVTLNITHNNTYIKQQKGSGTYFFHVLINNKGWVVGNGGNDYNTTNMEIEKNAIQMIEKNSITKKDFNNIMDIKSISSRGHFVIKAPNGTYALYIKYYNKTYNETGTLKPGQCLVIPNDPTYFKKGKYQSLSGNAYIITSSRILAAKDEYGVERRDIITYSYKRNKTKSNVKIYACNDDGRYVNKSTGKLVDSIRTNTKFYPASEIPSLEKWLLVDDVNFTTGKLNTTIKSKNIKVNKEDIVLTTTVTDENNQKVNSGFVSFLFDNRTIKDENGKVIYVNVTNGTASINHTISNFWKKTNHTYYARYYGTSQYMANKGKAAKVTETNVISLTSFHAPETRFGTNLTINALVLYKADNTTIDVGHVLFKVNGKTIRNPDNSTLTVDVVSGTAVFNLDLDEKYSAKPYKVTVVYGYGVFREEYNTTVSIHKVPTNVTNTLVSVKDTVVHVVGKFVDDNKKLIPYKSYLSVKIDGKTLKDSNNKTMKFNITDGKIDFFFVLKNTYKKGNHTLTLVIPELRETLGVRVNTTMTIVKKKVST